MRFPEMTPVKERRAREDLNNVLGALGLKEGGTEFRILMELSKTRTANVYELWKRLPDVGHYSTVLRAIKRLNFREKNLVQNWHASKGGRRKTTYTLTLFGDLIVALVKGGWRSAAQLLAESSLSFCECILAHFSRDPYYYWSLTRHIIEEVKPYIIIDIPEIEEIVRRIEINWIKEHITEALNDPSSRSWISTYLKRMAHVNWIISTRTDLLSFIDSYIKEQEEWLQVLNDCKSDLLAVEKHPKLTEFSEEKVP
jgi:DNA-binding PadR family transcriptional regulator